MNLNKSRCIENSEFLTKYIKIECEEKQYFLKVIEAFKYYRSHSYKELYEKEKYYNELPENHQLMLSNFIEHLYNVRLCIDKNYEIIKLIIEETDCIFQNQKQILHSVENISKNDIEASVKEFDMDKIKSTIKQFVREWSTEGETERNQCISLILNQIKLLFSSAKTFSEKQNIEILVPGSGLGRLAFEIAQLGYACQGNEFSLYMLFATNFIINRCKEINSYTLHPYVHQWCNNMSSSDQIRSIQFPDINPSSLSEGSKFSMIAGDFLEIYQDPDRWDCIATAFFIDTAHNILAYIEAIYNILKPGGYWINFGPLLYHFAEMANENSIEISYEDLKTIIQKFNFTILKEEQNIKSTYTQNQKSMLHYQYKCIFFVAQKPY